jgi:hypothetical protein
VPAADAPDVRAVRQAYAIEEAKGDVAAKAGMLNAALRTGNNLLVFYAIDYLRRHKAEREQAVRVLAGTIASTPPSDQKLELGRALTNADFLERAAKADAVNGMISATILQALVQESDGRHRSDWAQLAASVILMDYTADEAENRKVRFALAHAPGAPMADRVIATLASAEQFATPDALPRLRELRAIFEAR